MKKRLVMCSVAFVGFLAVELLASGQAGIYGVVERVVFEPSKDAPERAQVWGAFALIERGSPAYQNVHYTTVQGQLFTNYVFQKPTRGYLYFTLPTEAANIGNARREWADLASVVGTRQGVAFGYWDRFRGDKLMRIRDAAEKPAAPDVYYTDVGVAKLGATGGHAALVAELLKLTQR